MRIQQLDFSLDLLQSLIWQRNEAVNLTALLQDKQNWYNVNHTQFWTDWCRDVFDLRTANYFGLSVWCIILEVPYFIQTIPPITGPAWGFNEVPTINTNVNFERGNFQGANYPEFTLTLEEQRIVLRLRYFQLVTRGAIPEINTFLDIIFNDPDGLYQGGAWALDNFDMTMTYVFNCPISTILFNVLVQYDILYRPTGVDLDYTFL